MNAARDFDLREPLIDAYIAGLNASDRRWAEEAAEVALSDEMANGFFDPMHAISEYGMIEIKGSGDYEGWELSGYANNGPRDGYHLTMPPEAGSVYGSVVGFVVMNRDGTWTACHDPYNHRPGIGAGDCGSRVKVPSAEAAYRYVVAMQARHDARRAR